MKLFFIRRFLLLASAAGSLCCIAQSSGTPKFRHITTPEELDAKLIEYQQVELPEIDSTKFVARDPVDIFNSLSVVPMKPWQVNYINAPWIFSGYRQLLEKKFTPTLPTYVEGIEIATAADTVLQPQEVILEEEAITIPERESRPGRIINADSFDILGADAMPGWLRNALTFERIQQDFIYRRMLAHPKEITVAYWDLPVPPRLPEEDLSFGAYIKSLNLPDVEVDKAVLPDEELSRKHWLHNVNAGLQFSQAYLSPNWYQGGNNHISAIGNFYWNVTLNPVYHKKFLFQSTLQYKLGVYSNPKEEIHSYSISEDLLQYNLNMGLKAVHNWYYSFNMLFKTQMLNNYERTSTTRKAAFMSPGEFNIGLGMTYSKVSKDKRFQMNVAISPISYNLKTCINSLVDPTQYHIDAGKKSASEIGSNTEVNINWQLTSNINLKSRVFLFTDYSYFLGDWENTISFAINRFLSTQIYVHARYDSSSQIYSDKWKHLMLKEILSFGLSYTFSTKP